MRGKRACFFLLRQGFGGQEEKSLRSLPPPDRKLTEFLNKFYSNFLIKSEQNNPALREGRDYFAPEAGFEPATSALTGRRSTAELPRNIFI